MGTSINITDLATPALQRIHATLVERTEINTEMGLAVVTLCKTYVANDAGHRHTTAQTLGADPTGFLGAAVDAIHFIADGGEIIVDFSHFWFSRVGHDVDILPGPGKKFITIPIGAPAYGKRLQGNFADGKFFKGPSGALFFGTPYPGNPKVLQPLYLLVPSVHQKQDRSRLPSDQDIQNCAVNELGHQIEKRIAAITAEKGV